MATYKERAAFTLKRLKSFWRDFSRSKRGVLGVVIILFYVIIALIGPLLITIDPLFPTMPGYYPAGPAPIADVLCKPAWYKYLPGRSGLSENMKLISDHEFSSSEAMTIWNLNTNTPNLINYTYNPTAGSRNDGCIEISYHRPTSYTNTETPYLQITHNFTYPFQESPRKFWIHMSFFLNGTITSESYVLIEVSFCRFQTSPPPPNYTYPSSLTTYTDSLIIYKYPLHNITTIIPTSSWTHTWITSTRDSIMYDPKYYLKPQAIIFPTSGNYTFEIKISFYDTATTERDIKVYLDNLDVLIYGETYGLLGTDYKTGGPRDNLVSLIYGARISIFVGLLATFISVSLGLLVGLTAGYVGGLGDEVLMRLADFLMCLPGLPLYIVLMVVLGSSIWNVILLMSFLGWMGFSREIRSMTLSLRERAFVEAAKAAGAGKVWILFKHILPNVFALVYIALAVSVPGVVLTEATLSWLGLFDPKQISWGRMLHEFSQAGVAVARGIEDYWFWVIPPGVAIALLAIAFVLLGYSLDEILNPKLRVRR
jgi:ABC-type dipeptide/oligopeptide/nickel transport system permease subunit